MPALADLRSATGDRPGILRVQEGAHRDRHPQWLKRPGIDRDLGEDVLHCEVDCGFGRRDDAVHRSSTGRAGPGQVEFEVVPDFAYGESNLQRFVDHPVRVHDRRAVVFAGGDGCYPGSHLLGGARLKNTDRLLDRIGSVTVEQRLLLGDFEPEK